MARLSQELIVETALGLLDQVGLEGLTTRRLADELGVKSPALYWHFASRQALLDAVSEAMLDRAAWADPGAPGADPASWLADRARAFRRGLLAHRDGALVNAGTRPAAAELPAIEIQVSALAAAGLTPQQALRTVLAVSRYTIGWVFEEQAADRREDHARSGGEAGERDGDPGREDPLAGLPVLAAARGVLEQRDPDADFEFGLNALITGLLHSLT